MSALLEIVASLPITVAQGDDNTPPDASVLRESFRVGFQVGAETVGADLEPLISDLQSRSPEEIQALVSRGMESADAFVDWYAEHRDLIVRALNEELAVLAEDLRADAARRDR